LEKYCFFGINDEMVVAISERFKFRQVKSRMSAIIVRFILTNSGSESMKSMRKPRD